MPLNRQRGEFKLDEFFRFCRQRDIKREYTTPYSATENKIVERFKKELLLCSNIPNYRMTFGYKPYLQQYT